MTTEQNNKMREMATERFGAEKLEALERKHGKLSVIIVEDKMALFRAPDRKVISAASVNATSDPLDYVETIAENCFVEGDRELIDVDEYFLGIVPVINELVQPKTATLLKL